MKLIKYVAVLIFALAILIIGIFGLLKLEAIISLAALYLSLVGWFTAKKNRDHQEKVSALNMLVSAANDLQEMKSQHRSLWLFSKKYLKNIDISFPKDQETFGQIEATINKLKNDILKLGTSVSLWEQILFIKEKISTTATSIKYDKELLQGYCNTEEEISNMLVEMGRVNKN